MSYTKDYYHILGLAAPGWRSTKQQQQQQHVNFTADLRRAYKAALLAAHPDKKSSNGSSTASAATTSNNYTIDDIKQAYTTLSDPRSRAEYETWFLHHGQHTLSSNVVENDNEREKEAAAANADFVLGLEILDLSEFEMSGQLQHQQQPQEQGRGEVGEEKMQWTRACRCGAEKGFLILEEELEDAEEKGLKEVLVGCEGCSLWVRVGFDVEVEEEG